MKELLLIGTTVFALTTGSVIAVTSTETPERPERGAHVSVARINQLEVKAQDAIDAAKMEQLRENKVKVSKAIEKLSTYVGKTWYVFSGATPSGWDCSGLTLWFYEQLDVELEHRASKQGNSGQRTSDPKPGDLAVFKYDGSQSAYHVGIYIGNGQMVHSPKRGHLTRIESVEDFAGEYSSVSYRSFINYVDSTVL